MLVFATKRGGPCGPASQLFELFRAVIPPVTSLRPALRSGPPRKCCGLRPRNHRDRRRESRMASSSNPPRRGEHSGRGGARFAADFTSVDQPDPKTVAGEPPGKRRADDDGVKIRQRSCSASALFGSSRRAINFETEVFSHFACWPPTPEPWNPAKLSFLQPHVQCNAAGCKRLQANLYFWTKTRRTRSNETSTIYV